mgnify:CR=1 FL=1
MGDGDQGSTTYDQRLLFHIQINELLKWCTYGAIKKEIEFWFRSLETVTGMVKPFLKLPSEKIVYYDAALKAISLNIYDTNFYSMLSTGTVPSWDSEDYSQQYNKILLSLRKLQDELYVDMREAKLLLPLDMSNPSEAAYRRGN